MLGSRDSFEGLDIVEDEVTKMRVGDFAEHIHKQRSLYREDV